MHLYSFFVQIYMREAKLANEVRHCIERVCSKLVVPLSIEYLVLQRYTNAPVNYDIFCHDTNVDIATRYLSIMIL